MKFVNKFNQMTESVNNYYYIPHNSWFELHNKYDIPLMSKIIEDNGGRDIEVKKIDGKDVVTFRILTLNRAKSIETLLQKELKTEWVWVINADWF